MRPYHVKAALKQSSSLMNHKSRIETMMNTEARNEVRNCAQRSDQQLLILIIRDHALASSSNSPPVA